MTAPPDDNTADLHAVIEALRVERDAAVAREAKRDSDYAERAAHQGATVEVLQAMAASPGDAKPVFDLIVRRARDLCDAYGASLAQVVDGSIVLRAYVYADEAEAKGHEAAFPRPVAEDTMFGRTILARRPVQLPDVGADQTYALREGTLRGAVRAQAAVPLMRDGDAIGAINITRQQTGEFLSAQIELLQVFAHQAVIAITSAETYRALQTRTTDLQETLEYQTATSDVLKVINRSTFDLQPVLSMVAETAVRLCFADQAVIFRREGEKYTLAANFGFPAEYEAYWTSLGAVAVDLGSPSVGFRCIREACPVHIHDVAAVPGYDSYGEAPIKLGRQRTSLGVPLLRESEVIGTIVLARQRVEPFTDRQIELVSTFADQAVIAIENTRLMTEQQEALEQQTATAEVLQVIDANPGNLTPVFDAVLEKAMRLCGAAFGSLYTYDGERFHSAAQRGVPPAFAAFRAENPPLTKPGGGPAILLETRRPHHVLDLKADETHGPDYPGVLAMVELGGVRTILMVPLLKDETFLGYISIYRQEVRAFSDKQIALLESFAAQAVIAMENARLITEQREALEQQTATAEVLQVINASPGNLAPVFDAILDKAHTLCGAAIGSLVLFDDTYFRAVATHGWPNSITALFSEPAGPNRARQRLADGERFVQVADIRAIGRGPNSAWGDAVVESTDARTMLLVPLRKDGALLGFISSFRPEVRAFSDKEIALLENFAAQAVIAMENARLLTEQQEALEQQTATAEVLQVINASPGDLVPVFDTILAKALRLCEAAFGSLVSYDGEYFQVVATRGLSASLAKALRERGPLLPSKSIAYDQIVRGADIVHIPDITATGTQFPSSPNIDQDGARTTLFVALRGDDALFGAFVIYRKEVRLFSDKQIALLKNFAAQAVIAMENARLLTEQREALERQTATAEVLQVINASPGDLTPVFDAMLEKATRLCQAEMGTLWTYDGEYMQPAAMRGVPPAYADFLKRGPPRRPNLAQSRVLRGEQVTQTIDIIESEAYRSGDPLARAGAELGGIRTVLVVPLRKDEAALGTIGIYRQEVRAFTDKQIALLENFAAQAVIAMENARLISEQREALEQQTATAEVLQVINASPGNLAPVFDAILEKAHSLCRADHGSLYITDGETFRAVALRGMPDAFADLIRQPFRPGPNHPVRQLIAGAPFAVVRDALQIDDPIIQNSLKLAGMRSALFVPLRKDKVFLGYVVASSLEVQAFGDKHAALLQNFAAQAVIAMENARLINEQREALEQQTATAEVLQVINASPGNLTPVFDTILDKAMRLCGAAFGSLYTYDGEGFRSAAHRGVPSAYAEWRGKVPPSPRTVVPARILAAKRSIHVIDVMQEEEYKAGEVVIHKMVELGGIRTALSVPLLKDDVVLGFFTIFRQEVQAFSNKQIALLENFATQAVIAMENARLLDEIRQRQEELRVTFENMGDGVAMFDETQHLVAWNRKFQDILDVPDEALAARPTFVEYIRYLTERGEFGQGAEQEEQLRRIQATRGRATVFERTRPNGRVIEVSQNPVPGGGFVLIYADITERKRNEAEIRAARDAAEEASRTIEAAYRDLKTAQANLIQAEKMASLGQLTAGIAHEIKNPLNFVNNFAALSVDLLSELKETAAPGFAALTEKQRAEVEDVSAMLTSNLEKITEHGKRADGIVKAMLEHSRGSSGERRMVDLNALIDEALNLAYHGARAQDQSFNITLERDFGAGIAPIEVNPQDITRVFLNIFSNGFYAVTRRAREGGDAGFVPTLKVTTRDAGEAVEIRVRDNGTGIPVDIRDKLFQPFFTTKPTGEGTGLGLSITYDIVMQQHGGTITVDSEFGSYSEFAVRLPRNP